MSGVRVEVAIDSPPDCTVAQVSEAANAKTSSISKCNPTDPEEPVTEEFVLESDVQLDSVEVNALDSELREVFSYGDARAYRFDRSRERPCPCNTIEQHDCPVLDVYSRGGSLVISFHAPNMETLRSAITDLNEGWSGVSVHRLIRSRDDREDQDLVLVDRSELTDRQKEVITTAHEMGYFDHPKGANAGEVAEELGINASTFTEHVAAAQRKILSAILTE